MSIHNIIKKVLCLDILDGLRFHPPPFSTEKYLKIPKFYTYNIFQEAYTRRMVLQRLFEIQKILEQYRSSSSMKTFAGRTALEKQEKFWKILRGTLEHPMNILEDILRCRLKNMRIFCRALFRYLKAASKNMQSVL